MFAKSCRSSLFVRRAALASKNEMRGQKFMTDERNGTTGLRLRYLTSSLPEPPTPRFSRRNQFDLFILVLGAVGSWVYLRGSDLNRDILEAREALLNSSRTQKEGDNTGSSMENLPPPMQRYLKKATGVKLDNRLVVAPFLEVQQYGSFLAAHQWYPFTACLLVKSSSNALLPGFVWDAEVTILGMPNRILESLINGQGRVVTKAWSKIPMIQVVEEEPFLLFWLAMTPLFPRVFLHSEKRKSIEESCFEWNSVHDLSACSGRLTDTINGEGFDLDFDFDPDTQLLMCIRVKALSLRHTWQATYSNYQPIGRDQAMVPVTIEIGKWYDEEDLRYHMKLENRQMSNLASHGSS